MDNVKYSVDVETDVDMSGWDAEKRELFDRYTRVMIAVDIIANECNANDICLKCPLDKVCERAYSVVKPQELPQLVTDCYKETLANETN